MDYAIAIALRTYEHGFQQRRAHHEIPHASFRKMIYKSGIWDLLEKFGLPEVVFVIDEVTEVYKAANNRLPKAVDALRTIC